MTLSRRDFLAASAATLALGATATARPTATKKLVMIAGTPSHGALMHEHNAGTLLLAKCLKGVEGLTVEVILNGYPKEDAVLDYADGIFCYADGGGGHPLIQGTRMTRVAKLLDKGVGLMCCHYAVEVPKDMGDRFRDWIGGCYEHQHSCNPIWEPEYKELPKHEITSGVKPFQTKDEWYFNMRFRPEMKGVTPILTAYPPDKTRDGPYVYPKGPYEHIQKDKGRAEHMMWATERTDGGRGVGCTGGHFHNNWGNDNFRKTVLNALLWICKVPVPAGGVEYKVTDEELKANLDPKKK
ncbi:MAG: ThuA domain-containing protein [Fimbriiglobus sp.]